jgi:hypothetical protein
MMEGRIGELDLSVRAPTEDAGPRARKFAERVLERAHARLERQLHGRLMLVRELSLELRLVAPALDWEAELDAFADVIAGELWRMAEATPVAQGLREPAPPNAEAVVFEEEAQWRALHWARASLGEDTSGWFYAALNEEGDAPGALVRRGAPAGLCRATLAWLHNHGHFFRCVSLLPERRAEALLEVLLQGGTEQFPEPEPGGGFTGHVAAAKASVVEEDAHDSRFIPSPPPPGSARARLLTLTGAWAPSQGSMQGAHRDLERMAETAGPSSSGPVDELGSARKEAPGPLRTSLGGALYLLSRALELDLGEALWRAGSSEAAISAAFAPLFGDESLRDPMLAALTGDHPPATCPDLEAHRELAFALLESVASALPRRGLAAVPDLTLSTRGHPEGSSTRILVATANGCVWPLFALPGSTPAEATAIVAELVRRWPASSNLHAPPGLAELDRTGRVRPQWRDGAPASAWLPDDNGSAGKRALSAQLAGVCVQLFCARAGLTGLSPTELVSTHLKLEGWLMLDHEELRLVLPLEAIDMPVRRAGLDANPGWVPWLGRHARIEFEGGEE